jgi:hypothetical protein
VTLKDAIAEGELDVGGRNITLRFPTFQLAVTLVSLAGLAASVVGAVWLTTRDLKGEVGLLRSAVNELSEVLEAQDERILKVEVDQEVVAEIQRRVLTALGYVDDPSVRRALRQQSEK